MKYTINKGKHRPRWWWLSPKMGVAATTIRRKVVFDFNCIYNLHSADQHDINKLFGVAFTTWWRMIWVWLSWPVYAALSRNLHHRDSARVGWRFDTAKKTFILSAYCYVEGQRITRDICECYANRPVRITLLVQSTFYEFIVEQHENEYPLGRVSIPYWHKKRFTFSLGLYFGGNNPAPNTMTVEIKKL